MRKKAVFRVLIVILLSLVVLCSSERSGFAASDIQSRLQDIDKKIDTWIDAGNDFATIKQLGEKLFNYVDTGENDKANKVIDEILLIISSNDVNQTKEDNKSDDIQPVIDDKNIAITTGADALNYVLAPPTDFRILKNITKTSGVYTCTTCSKAHKWYIDENHVLYWEGKPYIPHALTGQEYIHGLTQTYSIIDDRLSKGITEFVLAYEGDVEKVRLGSANLSAMKENDIWIDKTTDYIINKGGKYILAYSPVPCDVPQTLYDTNYFKRNDVRSIIEKEFRRIGPLVAKEGLRAIVFHGEINGYNCGGIEPPENESGFEDFKEMLNSYAKKMKEEIGNVPLTIRVATHINYVPYLYAMSGDYIDGVHPQYNAYFPDDVRQMMSDSPYIKYFNSFNKTKVMWTCLQVMTGAGFPPYVSYDVMWNQHKAAVENGATGNLLDMGDYGWTGFSEEDMTDTYRWYGQFKDPLKNLILQKAAKKEFNTGKYTPSGNLKLRYKTPVLTYDDVISIVLNDEDVANLLSRYPCFALSETFFENSSGCWEIAVFIPESEVELGYTLEVDDKTGTIARNPILLERQAKALGYDNTVDKKIQEYINKYGCK